MMEQSVLLHRLKHLVYIKGSCSVQNAVGREIPEDILNSLREKKFFKGISILMAMNFQKSGCKNSECKPLRRQ